MRVLPFERQKIRSFEVKKLGKREVYRELPVHPNFLISQLHNFRI
jgi:hypothetical protein